MIISALLYMEKGEIRLTASAKKCCKRCGGPLMLRPVRESDSVCSGRANDPQAGPPLFFGLYLLGRTSGMVAKISRSGSFIIAVNASNTPVGLIGFRKQWGCRYLVILQACGRGYGAVVHWA